MVKAASTSACLSCPDAPQRYVYARPKGGPMSSNLQAGCMQQRRMPRHHLAMPDRAREHPLPHILTPFHHHHHHQSLLRARGPASKAPPAAHAARQPA
mmetsp:Transcript_23478/g.60073  ORF Transcript_23478/g.60073 Transcript_23478/m.60073 type:complete len:98 (-) Transcript_23478:151-444(-)